MQLILVSSYLALVWFLFSIDTRVSAFDTCRIRKLFAGKLVCVCNKDYCDDLTVPWPIKQNHAILVQTSQAGKRFEVTKLKKRIFRKSYAPQNTNRITVDLTRENQPIIGWGGAITDATGINLHKIKPDLRSSLIRSYYGQNGLQYNFIRVPIGGTDFSVRPYTYDDSNLPDFELKNWALADEDVNIKIPFIQEAKVLAQHRNVSLKLFASSWSAPKWMKTSGSLVRGFLVDDDRVYQSYAEYLMKFFDAYEKRGINFWGATVQNDPFLSYKPIYRSSNLQMSAPQSIKFIANFLGPALEARGKSKKNFKLMIGDDSLDYINHYLPTIMANKEVQKYISGLAFHWYTSGVVAPYSQLTKLYDLIKDKIEFMIMSEACTGSSPLDRGVKLGDWTRGESYASDIIEDLSRNTSAWVDWNMALDMEGGPNWSKNFVDSPIIINEQKNEFYKQPMYYVLAHFSRFFKPGSIRVTSETIGKGVIRWDKSLSAVAVHKRETGHLIINILNTSGKMRKIKVSIVGKQNSIPSRELHEFVVDGKSINTVVLKL